MARKHSQLSQRSRSAEITRRMPLEDAHRELSQRSRSAEITRRMPTEDVHHDFTAQPSKGLNDVREIGLSGSGIQPMPPNVVMPTRECQERDHVSSEGCLAQFPNRADGVDLSDLEILPGMPGARLL